MQARICIWLLIIPVVAYIINDYIFFGYSWRFYAILMWRMGLLVYTLLLLNYLGKITDYRSYDKAILIWELLLSLTIVGIAASRPYNYIGHVIVAVIAIFIFSLVIPNKFTNQVLVTAAIVLGEVLVMLLHMPFQSQVIVVIVLTLLVSPLIAVLAAWQSHSLRRQAFLANERQQAVEEALRESESVLRTFFDSPGIFRGVVDMVDGDMLYVSVNKALAGVYDSTPEVVSGKFMSELGVPPELLRQYVESAEASRQAGEAMTFEILRPFPSGDRWLQTTVSYVGCCPVDYPRFAFITLDVTDRKRAEEEIAAARAEAEKRAAELESFFSSMVDGIGMVDLESQVLYINEAGREILRVPQDETFSDWMSRFKLFTIEGVPIPREETPSWRALHGERVKDFRYKVATPYGETLTLSVSASPVIDSEGRVISATLTFRDQAERVAFEAEKQNLLDREHRISETLQQSIIPTRIPASLSGIYFAARYVPAMTEAQVGGDFYDVFDLGDGKVAVLIGDVVGKGVRAAMQVSAARYAFRSYAYIESSPSKIAGLVNDALCKSQSGEEGLLTAFFAIIDTTTRTMSYTDAGHEPPVLRRSSGQLEELNLGGRAIAILPGCDYLEGSIRLETGDTVVLFTDGITEARSEERGMFGKSGVLEFLAHETAPPSELVDRLLEKAKEYGNGRLQDDVAIVAFGLERLTTAR